MQKVKINFENCFGIKRFKETLNFQEYKCVLIYAPNRTMKTSFAETLRLIGAEKSNQIKDRMNPNKSVVCFWQMKLLNKDMKIFMSFWRHVRMTL